MITLTHPHRRGQRDGTGGWTALLVAAIVSLTLGFAPAVATPSMAPALAESEGSEGLCAVVALSPLALGGGGLSFGPSSSALGDTTPLASGGRAASCVPLPADSGSTGVSDREGQGQEPVPCVEVPGVDDKCEAWVAAYDTSRSFPDGGIAVDSRTNRVYQTGTIWSGRCASDPRYICTDFVTTAYDADGNQLWEVRRDGPAGDYDQARDVELSPDGKVVYVTGYQDWGWVEGNMVLVAYDAETGAELWSSVYHDPTSRHVDTAGYHIALSPDGQQVYVTGWHHDVTTLVEEEREARDVLTVAFDAATGTQLWNARYDGPRKLGVDWEEPLDMTVSPDGTRAYVTAISVGRLGAEHFEGDTWDVIHAQDYATVAYNLLPPKEPGDPELGAELWAERFDGAGLFDSPTGGITVSLDGSHVFVTGVSAQGHTGALNVPLFDWVTLAYDAVTGVEVWRQHHRGDEGEDLGQTWNVSRGLAMSPNGDRLYVAGTVDSVFSDYRSVIPSPTGSGKFRVVAYDTATGAESMTATYSNPIPAPANQNLLFGMGVSPDGETVYLVGDTPSSGLAGPYQLAHSAQDPVITTVAFDSSNGSRRWVSRSDPGMEMKWAATAYSRQLGNPGKAFVVSDDGRRIYVSGYAAYGGIEGCPELNRCEGGFRLLAYDAG